MYACVFFSPAHINHMPRVVKTHICEEGACFLLRMCLFRVHLSVPSTQCHAALRQCILCSLTCLSSFFFLLALSTLSPFIFSQHDINFFLFFISPSVAVFYSPPCLDTYQVICRQRQCEAWEHSLSG